MRKTCEHQWKEWYSGTQQCETCGMKGHGPNENGEIVPLRFSPIYEAKLLTGGTYSGKVKEHLGKILHWLVAEVESSGGDGDGIWYVNKYDIDEVMRFAKEFLPTTRFGDHWDVYETDYGFKITSKTMPDRCQEALIVTDNKTMFDNRPDWQQVSMAY